MIRPLRCLSHEELIEYATDVLGYPESEQPLDRDHLLSMIEFIERRDNKNNGTGTDRSGAKE